MFCMHLFTITNERYFALGEDKVERLIYNEVSFIYWNFRVFVAVKVLVT